MRPTKWHCRARCGTAFHIAVLQVLSVPKLLADHSTLVGKVFQRLDKRQRIASGGQFVVAAFSCQNRPAPARARPIESTAVVFLSITIMIVATPPRASRQVVFEHAVDHFN